MSNTTTQLNHTTVITKPNDGTKNAKRWELLLNSLLELPAFFKVVVIIRLVIKRLFFLDLDEPH
ncbi:hypothetical protein M2G39_17085, partial [Vibrio vulnificus]|nr:hypothetical protein [Vibrio vulnificus]